MEAHWWMTSQGWSYRGTVHIIIYLHLPTTVDIDQIYTWDIDRKAAYIYSYIDTELYASYNIV